MQWVPWPQTGTQQKSTNTQQILHSSRTHQTAKWATVRVNLERQTQWASISPTVMLVSCWNVHMCTKKAALTCSSKRAFCDKSVLNCVMQQGSCVPRPSQCTLHANSRIATVGRCGFVHNGNNCCKMSLVAVFWVWLSCMQPFCTVHNRRKELLARNFAHIAKMSSGPSAMCGQSCWASFTNYMMRAAKRTWFLLSSKSCTPSATGGLFEGICSTEVLWFPSRLLRRWQQCPGLTESMSTQVANRVILGW